MDIIIEKIGERRHDMIIVSIATIYGLGIVVSFLHGDWGKGFLALGSLIVGAEWQKYWTRMR